MCLGIPGKIESVEGEAERRKGKINFGGILKEANLALVPEAKVGDYVIVHAGLAISKINEKEAEEVFQYLRRVDELGELSS